MPTEYKIIFAYWAVSLVISGVLTAIGYKYRVGPKMVVYSGVSVTATLWLMVAGAPNGELPWQIQLYFLIAIFNWLLVVLAASKEEVVQYTWGLFFWTTVIMALLVWLVWSGVQSFS